MANQLAGKTITITTHKDMNVDELSDLIKSAFSATQCRTCTSGGHLILREASELALATGTGAHATLT
jgi:hypothetical protein